ncbi:MAG: hypothetical protein ACOCWQ_05970 [Nanoarchaeota archaeon]
MVELVYTPRWFYGKDIIIDIAVIVVLSLIAFFGFTYYRMNRKRTHLYLGYSFTLLALSFVSKILTYFTVYYYGFFTRELGDFVVTYTKLVPSHTTFLVGFFLYRLFMLFGLYILYTIYQKESKTTSFFIMFLFVVMIYFARWSYFLFHLTAAVLMVMVTMKFFLNNRKKIPTAVRRLRGWSTQLHPMLIFSSFCIITLSHVIFVFIRVHTILYVVAEFVQLGGFILLLATFVSVLIHGKTRKD